MKVNCKNCRKEFNAKPYQIKRGRGKYCSIKCYREAAKEIFSGKGNPQYGKHWMKGKNNPNYKHGYQIVGSPKFRLLTLKGGARKRGLDFELTLDDIKQYWQANCFYCGSQIETVGLDRIDNSKGYTKNNLVSCCRLCNWMKRELTQKDFFNHINKIQLQKEKREKIKVVMSNDHA